MLQRSSAIVKLCSCFLVIPADLGSSQHFELWRQGTELVRKTGNLSVLENTTALLDWRDSSYNITASLNNIAISWYYLGKNKTKYELIKSYTSKQGPYTYSGRLTKTNNSSIQLDRVNQEDDGFYEVIVGPGNSLESDALRTEVTVTKRSAFKFSVVVRNHTYEDIRLPHNGSAIRLPSLSVSENFRVYVNISVSQTAPLPDIKMETFVGDVRQPEIPCGKTYICERHVSMASTRGALNGNVTIQLTFGVKNLNTIKLVIPLDTTESSESISTKVLAVAIVFPILAVVFIVTSIIIIVYCRKKRCGNEHDEGMPLQKTSHSPASIGNNGEPESTSEQGSQGGRDSSDNGQSETSEPMMTESNRV